MGVNDIFFERNVKESFSKVKEHMLSLEKELKESKEEILRLKEEVAALRVALETKVKSETPQNPQNQAFQKVSSGNEGVYSFIHSFTKHSFNSYAHNFNDFKKEFDNIFGALSQQEFLTFLTIYQLEEEIKNVSYIDVAKKLNLTEGCIRTYVSSLLKKGLPLLKKKHNNKQILLNISPEFRSLNLKQKLIDTFYNIDSSQKTLQENF